MKKIKNTIGLILMYLGAWLQGYKYILIIGIVLVTILEGCAAGKYSMNENKKYGCPRKDISKKPFNK